MTASPTKDFNQNVKQIGEDKEKDEKYEKRTLGILFLILLLDLLAFTCILPLFPAIMDYYAAKGSQDPAYATFNSLLSAFRKYVGAPDSPRMNSVFFGGLLGSLFSLLQFFSSPIFGALSDVFGRKILLLISVLGTLISYILWSVSTTFTVFVVSRVVGGFSKASISIATAVVADVCPNKRRGKGMAVIGISFSIGFLLGPLIGAWFAKQARLSTLTPNYYFATPAYFSIVLTLMQLMVIRFMLPETLVKENRKTSIKEVISKSLDYINPKSLFKFMPIYKKVDSKSQLSMQEIGTVYFVYLLIYSGLEFTLSFLTHLRFEYDSIKQGRMYFFAGFIMILVQGGYVRRLSSSNQKQAALRGLLCIVPAYLIVAMAYLEYTFFIGLTLYSVASGIIVPCLSTMISGYGSESDKGVVLGTFRSLGALARAIGPILSCTIFWLLGPTICYVIGSVLLVAPYIMLRKIEAQAAK